VSGWRVGANMKQGWRAVGGWIEVRDGVLTFLPHDFDLSTGGLRFSVAGADVVSVDIAPRTWHLLDGGLRKRLRLVLRDGQQVLFVVNRVNNVALRVARDLAPA
jgi:hypothetical protein